MPRETRFPALTVTAVMAVPTFMILSGHPAMGAATLGGVLLAWVTHARLLMRAEQTRDARLLDYAQTATHLGGDPAPVITAFRPRVPVDDDEGLFRPEVDERPWVHLRPSDY